MDFKVGDIIRGKINNGYDVTNENMSKAKVVAASTISMDIEILEYKADKDKIGRTFYVVNSKEDFKLVEKEKYLGIDLLQRIKDGEIKNCDVKVYKNNKYQFTIKVGEKAILDNPQFHVGMLTSDKYTYERVENRKEMTIAEIEKQLGSSIKIVENNK